MGYPLALTTFTAKQCYKLSVILDNAMLPKLGINRKMKRTVVYSPLNLGGIRYPSIASQQDYKSIHHFVHQLEWDKEVGKDIQIVLSQLQLQSGFVSPLMEDPDLPAPHLKKD